MGRLDGKVVSLLVEALGGELFGVPNEKQASFCNVAEKWERYG